MKFVYYICTIWALIHSSASVSSRMAFEDDSVTVTNTTKVEDDDVEVKHTIVVSTKLKNNNNRRGLHGSNEGDQDIVTYKIGRKAIQEDSGEVPIINGYKAVETTEIQSPDSRHKAYRPQSTFINRNIRDDYDFYPNIAINPSQWKPSNYYNNINYYNPDLKDSNLVRRIDVPYQNSRKLHRRISDDGMKEFYCTKCAELNGLNYNKGCAQQRSWITTTPKMKIDGKLAKLN